MKKIIAISIVAFTGSAFAAVPKTSMQDAATVRSALELPMQERVSKIKKQGPAGYAALTKIMFDDNENMNMRWKAVTAAARLGGAESKPEIEKALKDQTWYMRNAGLVAMRGIDEKAALTWARRLLNDKALLVRVAAVDAIAEIGSARDASLLWQQLNSKASFRKGQSLFIRQRVVEALARIEGPGKEAAFVQILNDQDPTLYPAAIQALERMTRKSMGPGDGTLQSQRAQWLAWWKSAKG